MRNYFCGWYFKCQSDTQTLAIIPAMHASGNKRSCSIQVITDKGAWNIPFPCEKYHYKEFHNTKKAFFIQIVQNHFSREGIYLNIHTPECSIIGSVRFGTFSPIRYDIMGPFRYVPFMECRHSVLSMKHSVNGMIRINESVYRFHNDIGYIESDRGYSFPKAYAWTQCFFEGGSLMLSVADIPFGRFHFTGIICVVLWHKKEYRLATYLGAKVIKITNGEIVIHQRNLTLAARLIKKQAHPLYAPINGNMNRTIHESASCMASYSFRQGENTLFSFKTDKASFEYEYPD